MLQKFGPVLRVGVRHSTSVLRPHALKLRVVVSLVIKSTLGEELIRMEETHVLATIADSKTAASWGEGKKNCKNSP